MLCKKPNAYRISSRGCLDEDKEGNDKDNDEDKEMDKSGRNIDINLIPPVTPFIPFLTVDTEMNNWILSGVCILKRTCKYGSVS